MILVVAGRKQRKRLLTRILDKTLSLFLSCALAWMFQHHCRFAEDLAFFSWIFWAVISWEALVVGRVLHLRAR
jgi:hypothetical protein